ncbi:hypothetical protein AB0I53_26200 [Saccharopolyspora sp. NPDC050389]|uniref:hypothetical protein n=1 Tax=Saccharopolyspora sp. NPDC050389 TaxID=3155516 RepID=UPI0033CDA4D3
MVGDLELAAVPALLPTGPPGIEIRLDGLVVGDLELRICHGCRVAVVEHIRIDRRCRRRGLATLAIDLLRRTWPDYRWSTAPIERSTEALGFWHSLDWPGPLGEPDECRHLLA